MSGKERAEAIAHQLRVWAVDDVLSTARDGTFNFRDAAAWSRLMTDAATEIDQLLARVADLERVVALRGEWLKYYEEAAEKATEWRDDALARAVAAEAKVAALGGSDAFDRAMRMNERLLAERNALCEQIYDSVSKAEARRLIDAAEARAAAAEARLAELEPLLENTLRNCV